MEFASSVNNGGQILEAGFERVLDSINFNMAARAPSDPNHRPQHIMHYHPTQTQELAQFYSVDNRRLHEENQILKRDLQSCCEYISKQEKSMQEVKQFEEAHRKYLERQRRKIYREQKEKDMKMLEMQILQRHQIEMQVTNAKITEQHSEIENLKKINAECRKRFEVKIAEQHKELETMKKASMESHTKFVTTVFEQRMQHERMKRMYLESQRKLEAQKTLTKEVEKIMMEKQEAVEFLELQKIISQGKLKGICDYVKRVNSEFAVGLDELKNTYDLRSSRCGDFNKNCADGQNDDDEDEIEVKNLEKTLNALSALVREALEDCIQARQRANNMDSSGISKIHLRKQTVNQGSPEDWSIVPCQNLNVGKGSTSFSNKTSNPISLPALLPCQRKRYDNNQALPNGIVQGRRNKRKMCHCANPDLSKPNSCCCGYQAGNKHGLRKHLSYFKQPRLVCSLCDRKLVGRYNLLAHYRFKHKIVFPVNNIYGDTFPSVTNSNQQQQNSTRQRNRSPVDSGVMQDSNKGHVVVPPFNAENSSPNKGLSLSTSCPGSAEDLMDIPVVNAEQSFPPNQDSCLPGSCTMPDSAEDHIMDIQVSSSSSNQDSSLPITCPDSAGGLMDIPTFNAEQITSPNQDCCLPATFQGSAEVAMEISVFNAEQPSPRNRDPFLPVIRQNDDYDYTWHFVDGDLGPLESDNSKPKSNKQEE